MYMHMYNNNMFTREPKVVYLQQVICGYSDVAFHNAIIASLQDAHDIIVLFVLYMLYTCVYFPAQLT